MKNLVRITTLGVVKRAKDVKINHDRIKELAKEWAKQKIVIPSWPKKFHLETSNERIMLDYLIILDAINFCFWSRGKRWQIEYMGEKYNGYFALSLALKRFFEKNPEKANIKYFSEISFKEFSSILAGSGELMFLKKRWQVVRAVSRALIGKYGGDSKKFILAANKKFSVLVPKIYRELPYFDDICYYKNKRINILKRAQILAADIYCAFGGKGIGYFGDPEYLTVFADYKLPQILNYWGVLEYSKRLEKKIVQKRLLLSCSSEEAEIRSATIWAVEYLKEELAKLGKNFYSFEVDWILWNKSQKLKIRNPYHLTKTIYY